MRGAFAPSKNAAHGLACRTLYRALLQKCAEFRPTRVPSNSSGTQSTSSTLRDLVRYRFKQDRKFKNWQQIRDALQFGRGALQLLTEAAAGSSNALQEMARIAAASKNVAVQQSMAMKQLQDERKQRTLPKKLAKLKAHEAFMANKSNYCRKPDTAPVLERPLPYDQTLKRADGRRRVPDYFVVQGVPILRYTRKQPLPLGRYINSVMLEHDKLWSENSKSKELVHIASAEDEWDAQLHADHNIDQPGFGYSRDDEFKPWTATHKTIVQENMAKINQYDANRLESGRKLWEVFLKEEALAKEENAARKEERRRQWAKEQVAQVEKDAAETHRVAALFEEHKVEDEQENCSTSLSDYKPFSH